MQPAPRRWQLTDSKPLPGHPPVLGGILASRGLDAAAAAQLLDRNADYHDPGLLKGMGQAVAALGAAMGQRRRIAVYGDYDADGVSACALLTRSLRAAGADVVPYIPNRVGEGYGLHAAALEELAAQGVDCVVTVDCGTSSVAVAAGRPPGMTLIVTDHHLPLQPDSAPPALAPADALVNPRQPGCDYPCPGLAGAGVAWKLVQALEAERLLPAGSAERALGLAALGTVADMMPLQGENRRIVTEGLSRLGELPGIAALCAIAGLPQRLRASDIGFGIAPRINAAGRMEDARLALDLCLTDDPTAARLLAEQLNTQNASRRAAVAQAHAQAQARVESLPEDLPAIILASPDWPAGIVGLVAGRLAEKYARPTFIACLDGDEATGSARSACGVHVLQALEGAADTLLRYGGHAAAAGFGLKANRFQEFVAKLSASVAGQLDGHPRERVFHIDAEIVARDATPELAEVLDQLEPCGQGNPQPALMLRDATVLKTKTFGADRQHIGITAGDGSGQVEAIAFHKPGISEHLPRGRRIDLCFALERDDWQGRERVRLRLHDIRPATLTPTSGGVSVVPIAK